MSQTTPADSPPVPFAPSFNDFSFMSIGPRRPLFARLGMAPQVALLPEESANPAVVATQSTPFDTSSISLGAETSDPSMTTNTTTNSPTLNPVAPPHGLIPRSFNSAPENPPLQPPSTHREPSSAMDVDEQGDHDVLESPHPAPSRIPQSYRTLPVDHYFVAPPAVLPYPRSPSLRIDENHSLYTPASLFAHLPRAPPLSPRLDPLTVLELETTREQSEWEQVRKDLERSTPKSLLVESCATDIQPTPQPLLAIDTDVKHQPLGPASTSPADVESDIDSSDVELRVYDHVSPVASRATVLPGLGLDPSNPRAPSARSLSPSKPVDQPRSSITPSGPIQHREPKGSFDIVPQQTQFATSSGASPSGAVGVSNTMSSSPKLSNTTPAKRKHGAMDDFAQDTAQPTSSVPEQVRFGVPPPLRASVDRTPALPAPSVLTGATSSKTSGPPPVATSQLQVTIPATISQLSPSPAQTPSSATNSEFGRKPCRFYNRPPGRVCVRKEECPDLHEGPLQRPLSASTLGSSPAPSFPIHFGSTDVPGNANTTTTAPAPAIPALPTISKGTSTVCEPASVSAHARAEPSASNNPDPQPIAPAPLRRPAVPIAPVSALKRPSSTGLPSRPLSSVDRPATPPCRFFNTPRGCNRGMECPFRHERETTRSTRAPSRSSAPGINGLTPTTSAPSGPPTQRLAPNASSSAPGAPLRVISRVSAPANGTAAKTTTIAKKEKKPETMVVKTERESPGPKTLKEVIKTRAPPLSTTSRQIKEEEVIMRDLVDEPAAAPDQQMVGGSGNSSVEHGSILPLDLASASNPRNQQPQAEPPVTPRPTKQAKAPVRQQNVIGPTKPISVHPASVPPVPTPAPAPVPPPPSVVSTVVIPPTPAHSAPNKTTIPQSSVPPSRDSRMLDTRDHRELLTRTRSPPPRNTVRNGRVADTYRRSYDPRRPTSRSPSPPHSRGRSPYFRNDSPPRSRRQSFSRSRSRSHYRSRSRSFSPPLRLGGTSRQYTRPRRYSPRRSISPRPAVRYSRSTSSYSRSRSPSSDRYSRQRSPLSPTRGGRVSSLRAISPRGEHWQGGRSPRVTSPRSPPNYRQTNVGAHDNEYRPTVDNRLAPSNPANLDHHDYGTGPSYYPPRTSAPKTGETNGRHSPLPPVGSDYQYNHAPQGAQISVPIYPNHSIGHPQGSGDSNLRLGFSAGTSTSNRLPDMRAQPNPNPNVAFTNKPILLPANYDTFEQSMTMDMSSPPTQIRNPSPPRLQDRVDQYPGFVPANEVPSTLYARMTGDREQPRLTERLTSETHPQSRTNKGQRSNASGNAHLAARLGVSGGERYQPLANRLQDEYRPRSNHQNRDREPPARPGGGLMARMVGDKKPGEQFF